MPTISKARAFHGVGYRPHVGQVEIHSSRARNRVVCCGRRFGKSRMGAMELWPELLATYDCLGELEELGLERRYWIVGPNYDDAEKEWRVIYDIANRFKVPWDKPGTYNDSRGGNMAMSVFDGKFHIECRSAQHEDSLDGEGLRGALLVEAAKMKPKIWLKYIRPALADQRGWSLHTSTPEGKNHFYELWQHGQDPSHEDWASWRRPSWVNEVIFPGGRSDPEILSLEADMSSERFAQEIGAEFTDFVGRVFKDFDEETHVGDFPYNPRWKLFGAVDYGWTNPFVWLDIQVDVWDNVYVINETYRRQTDVHDIARELKQKGKSHAGRFYPDPADPGSSALLSKVLQVPIGGNTGGPLKDRLEMIRQHLKMGPEHASWEDQRPRLFIDRSCIELIGEMQDYRYPEHKNEQRAAPEEPLDRDNHGPEALGRFFRGHFGPLGSDGQKQRAKVRAGMT